MVTAARQQLVALGVVLGVAAERVVDALLVIMPGQLVAVAGLVAGGGFDVAAAAAGLADHVAGTQEWFLTLIGAYPAASPLQLLALTGASLTQAVGWLYDELSWTPTAVAAFAKGAGSTSTVVTGLLFTLGVSAGAAVTALQANFSLSLSNIAARLLGGGYSAAAVASAMAELGQGAAWVAERLRVGGVDTVTVANALASIHRLRSGVRFGVGLAGGRPHGGSAGRCWA